jgi:hypothetical protein
MVTHMFRDDVQSSVSGRDQEQGSLTQWKESDDALFDTTSFTSRSKFFFFYKFQK